MEKSPLNRARLQQALMQQSRKRLYALMLRHTSYPFAAPFAADIPTLTERVVRVLKQRSFFHFEISERFNRRRHQNKFSRFGSENYQDPYEQAEERLPVASPVRLSWLQRLRGHLGLS